MPVRSGSAARLLALLVAACGGGEREPDPPPPPPAPEPAPGGSCREIPVEGLCSFRSVSRAASAPGGGARYHVHFTFDEYGPDDPEGRTTLRVVAGSGDAAELEEFYRARSPAPCAGVRITPPCAPSVIVSVDLPPPPVGTLLGPGDP